MGTSPPTPTNSEAHPICGYCHFHSASLETVVVVAAAEWVLPQVGRHFVMMRVWRVEDVAWCLGHIAGKRVGVGRIRLGGVGHQARMLVHLRGHRPAHVSAYQSRVPYLGGFVLVARQSRWLKRLWAQLTRCQRTCTIRNTPLLRISHLLAFMPLSAGN
jgi:hypothetical protein